MKSKQHQTWMINLALILIALSVGLYYVHYLIFHDKHHIFIYLLGDIAFVPIEVLMVTLIIHRMLQKREKMVMMEKLNMLIGAFYSESGTELIRLLSAYDKNKDEIGAKLVVTDDWTEHEFALIKKKVRQADFEFKPESADLKMIKEFLIDRRKGLLRLVENPNLFEHENFTDLLWAVFHLAEELAQRPDLTDLPVTDYQHIAGDMKRAYKLLVYEWIDYMKHLKKEYPYLFSLARRMNPFDSSASVVVN